MGLIKKFLGIILLFGGLAIIVYSLYSSYNIFNAKKEAPVIFETPMQSAVQDQLQKMLGDQLKGFLGPDAVSKLFNLVSWSIFAGILVWGGAQISGLGIRLL